MGFLGFVRKVAATIERNQLARQGERILVAVSGGADSVALLAALEALTPDWSFRLTVAHLDHGLRGSDGAQDRQFVEALAARFHYPCVSEAASLEDGPNLEARARATRYRFLDRAARRAECGRIAVGHTQGDQAETVLLRLLRGAGARGLAGMAPRTGRLIRPLLECSREEALEFLRARGLPWVEDATNRNERFARNRVRHRLLPALVADAGPGIIRGLARTAALLRDEDRLLDELAARALEAATRGASLGVAGLRETPPPLRRRVLRLWLAAARGSLRGIGATHIRALERSIAGHESSIVMLAGGRVRSEAGTLHWETGEAAPAMPFSYYVTPGACVSRADLGWEVTFSTPAAWSADYQLPGDQWTAVFDLCQLPLPLTLRSVRPGDRIRAIGLAGSQKLQDLLINEKVPRSMRPTLPLLAAGNEVLWVPGYRRSDRATLNATSTAVMWAAFRRMA
jgi:tRNA(Ile)-lysidine synthase